jgi:hypothetical protein
MAQANLNIPYPSLNTGDIVALMTSYGYYLRWVEGQNGSGKLDASGSYVERFTVTSLPNNQIALRANNGKYLSLVKRIGIDLIEAAGNTPDENCKFTVVPSPSGPIGLKAANGKFLSVLDGNGNRGEIRPVKDTPDERAALTVVPLFVNQLLKPVLHTNDKIVLKTVDAKYWSRDSNNQTRADKDQVDAACAFTLTNLPGGKIALRANNRMYLSLGENGLFYANKDKLDRSCRLRLIYPIADGKFVLQASNGKYLSLISYPDGNKIQAVKDEIEKFCWFEVINVGEKLIEGTISLQDQRGKYLSLVSRGEGTWLEAGKDAADVFCRFTFTALPNGQIALALGDKYFGRTERWNGQLQVFEPTRDEIDQSCKLTVKPQPNGRITLQADNGKYLASRRGKDDFMIVEAIGDGGGTEFSIIPHSEADKLAWFELMNFSARPNDGTIALQDQRGKYLSLVSRGEGTWLEAGKAAADVFCHFTFTALPNGQIALALGGKYFGRTERWNGQLQVFEPTRDEIDQTCKLTVKPQPNGRITLQADNGKYLASRRGKDDFMIVEAIGEGGGTEFSVIPLSPSPQALAALAGSVIVLQADNGKYLNDNSYFIEVEASGQPEPRFKKIELRFNSDSSLFNSDQPDSHSEFKVTALADRQLALSSQFNEKYLGRTVNNDQNLLQADKGSPDESCAFTLVSHTFINTFTNFKTTPSSGPKIALRANNGKYLSRVTHNQAEQAQASKESLDPTSLFNVLWCCSEDGPSSKTRDVEHELRRPRPLHHPARQTNQVLWLGSDGSLKNTYGGQHQPWQTMRMDDVWRGVPPAPFVMGEHLRLIWKNAAGQAYDSRIEPDRWVSEKVLPLPSLYSPFAPGVLSDGQNSLDVFLCDSESALWHCAWTGAGWQMQLIADGPLFCQPVPIYSPATRLKHVFWCDARGQIRNTCSNGSRWQTEFVAPANTPARLALALIVPPAAVYNPRDQSINLFWFDQDSTLHTAQGGTPYTQEVEEVLPDGSIRRASFIGWMTKIVYEPPYLRNTFIQTQPLDRPVYVASDGRKCRAIPAAGQLAQLAAPAAVDNPADGSLHVFWRAKNEDLIHCWHLPEGPGSGWQAAEIVVASAKNAEGEPVTISSPPAPFFNPLQNRLEVFWSSNDGNLYKLWKEGNAWLRGGAGHTERVNA